MSDHMVLDIDQIARIALMFIDGDALETAVVRKNSDSTDDITYRYDDFNKLKFAITNMERMNPALDITGVLWQRRPDNHDISYPAVAGKSLPCEGPDFYPTNPDMKRAYATGRPVVKQRENGKASHYFPVRNSDAEIVGLLELLHNVGEVFDF